MRDQWLDSMKRSHRIPDFGLGRGFLGTRLLEARVQQGQQGIYLDLKRGLVACELLTAGLKQKTFKQFGDTGNAE